MSRFRRWVGTWNNYTEDGVNILKNKLIGITKCYILGREVAPTTNTPHLQLYLELKNAKSMSAMKLIHDAIHWENAVKPRIANVRYCMKGGNYETHGLEDSLHHTSSSYALRKEELAIQDSRNFSRTMPAIDYLEGVNLWNSWFERFKTGQVTKTTVIYITGPTGSGKTWKAFEIAGESYTPEDISIVEPSNGFLNGLNLRAPCWIFPEFRPATLEATVFLQILDIYPFVANVKGTHMLVRPEMILIASIKYPEDIYKEEINRQFRRRITQLIQLTDAWRARETEVSDTETEILNDSQDLTGCELA